MSGDLLMRQRVERCHAALSGYSDADLFLCLVDLLADALHWCDANCEAFDYALAVAGKHYVNELNDEQTNERTLP